MIRSEADGMFEHASCQLTDRLDAHVAQIIKYSSVQITKEMEENDNMRIVRGTLKRFICSMVTTMRKDYGVQKALEAAIIKVFITILEV